MSLRRPSTTGRTFLDRCAVGIARLAISIHLVALVRHDGGLHRFCDLGGAADTRIFGH